MAKLLDLDSQIKALENDLISNGDSNGESDAENYSDTETESVVETVFDNNLVFEKDKFGNPVRIYSKLEGWKCYIIFVVFKLSNFLL